ncbi:hypothetical protein NHX12_021656 [Muraenolepis orangiensis]|uniref:Uncharacterized protein n=1 Tax=Muraenolepis orangiensis TaxID=630683 RepID=A0A9Q0ETK9_9TELE|nr:hypothetical protein NHX12_021656 [Muraenolepis orangiensis]
MWRVKAFGLGHSWIYPNPPTASSTSPELLLTVRCTAGLLSPAQLSVGGVRNRPDQSTTTTLRGEQNRSKRNACPYRITGHRVVHANPVRRSAFHNNTSSGGWLQESGKQLWDQCRRVIVT